ncbi:MAG: sugar phosphate isomerase/epimerase family protein [Pseudomonadota bacterium]
MTDDLLPVCERLKAAGYDGVEVPVFEADPDYYAALGAKLDDIGLARTVVGLVTSEEANPLSENAKVHAAGVEHLKWLVDCSNALGAEVLCGPFTQPLAVFSGTGPTDGEWGALVSAHKAMAAHAAGAGLMLAVEPLNRFECYALTTNADAARLVAEVGADNYGYLYDTFHSNIEERDPVGCIPATAEAISHVHISENDRGTPGRGHVDFQATFDALAASGYDGWLTIEAFGQALPDLAAATKVWRRLYGSEEEVYTEGLTLLKRGWAAAKGP